jgi:sugar lactone lactonase YvrE
VKREEKKKMIRRVLFIFLVAALAGCSTAPDNQKAEPQVSSATPAAPPDDAKWAVTEGINAPESVYVDTEDGFIFVSDIGGAPDQRDGNGYISKLGPDGKVIAAQWVTGLNAPKGLRSYKGTLWTADLDEVVSIDIASGKVASHVKIDGAKFLNDVACGPDGTVYVSDTVGTRIYAVKDGKASVFAEGDDIEYPNGLLVEGDKLVVAGWGKPEADFSTKVPGRLFSLDLKTKKKTLITPEPFGNIDGIESDGQGGYIVSDYLAGKIMQVGADGKGTVLKQLKQGTADIAYIPAQKLVIVPQMSENKIAAYTF